MALATDFKDTSGVKVGIYKEDTLGDGGLQGATTGWILPTIEIPEIHPISVPLQEAPKIYNGRRHPAIQDWNTMLSHGQMLDVTIKCICTPTVADLFCLAMMEDGSGANTIEMNYERFLQLGDGDSITESWGIYVQDGGWGEAGADKGYYGCVAKSMEISHSADAEAGLPIITMVFTTGYAPVLDDALTDGDVVFAGSSTLDDVETAPAFSTWVEADTWIGSNASSCEVLPYEYTLTISRNFLPVTQPVVGGWQTVNGYAMDGNIGANMSMTFKRDSNLANFNAHFRDNSRTEMQIGDGSLWNIWINGKVTNTTIDSGNSEFRQSVSIFGTYSANATFVSVEF